MSHLFRNEDNVFRELTKEEHDSVERMYNYYQDMKTLIDECIITFDDKNEKQSFIKANRKKNDGSKLTDLSTNEDYRISLYSKEDATKLKILFRNFSHAMSKASFHIENAYYKLVSWRNKMDLYGINEQELEEYCVQNSISLEEINIFKSTWQPLYHLENFHNTKEN